MKKSKFFSCIIICSIGIGCGSINNSLRDRINDETKGLETNVEDGDEVERHARLVLEDEYKYIPDVVLPSDAKLESYILLALQRNPSIHRMLRQLQGLGYRVEQVTSLDDPMFNLVPPTGDMLETAAGMMNASFGLSQKLPFPGKLKQKGLIAEQEVRMAFADLADMRVQVSGDVARAYYDYYLASVSITITNDSRQLLEQIRDVAAARYRSGSATQQDVLRAEVELYSLLSDLLKYQQEEITAKTKLNTLMNRSVEAELPPPSPLELSAIEWKLPALVDKGLESNPKLSKIKEQLVRDLEAMKLAKLEYYPDMQVGFNYNMIGSGISPVATGSDNWSIPLGVNLPIWWPRIRASINSSNAKALSSVAQFEEVRNLVFFGLQDSITKIDTQYRQAVLFRDLIVPRSRQAVEVSTANYKAGQIEFTAIVENWRNWLKFSLAYYRSLAGLEQHFADLQQLIGASTPRVQDSNHAQKPELEKSQNNNILDLNGENNEK